MAITSTSKMSNLINTTTNVTPTPHRQKRQRHHRHHNHHLPTDMGSKWATQKFGQNSYPYIVTASVLTYWSVVSIIPIYNKYFFNKTLYPYPIASAGIQLGLVSILLLISNVLQHYWSLSECVLSLSSRGTICSVNTKQTHEKKQFPLKEIRDFDTEMQNQQLPSESSWIFGPHLAWKLKWCFPIGILFGIKYGVTNLGLHLVPAPTHLLLQSTDMVWTSLSAWIINREHITGVGLACVVGCVAGSAVLGVRVGQTVAAPVWALGVNLLSPILLGLCITTLRLACTELMAKGNRVGGSVSSFELSALKLAISSPVALILACILEGEKVMDDGTTTPSWLQAFLLLPRPTKLGVMGGALLVLIFQVNCTFLAFLTSAIDVGLCGQVKIIPQWITAALFYDRSSLHISELNGIGAALTMTSAAVFVLYDWLSYKYPDTFSGASWIDDYEVEEGVVCCGGEQQQGEKQGLLFSYSGEEQSSDSLERNYDSIIEEGR